MRVLSLDGDENIWAFYGGILQVVQNPEFGSTRKVHHERVDDIATFVPMVRSCGIILATTTRSNRYLNSRQHTRCAEKLVIVVQAESGPYPSRAAVASIRLSPAVSLKKWASR
jgi:hypothetical protein